MATKKDIGEIFREGLKNVEQTPEHSTWDSIASELDKKGSQKLAPLWYYLGGFVILGLIGSFFFFTDSDKITTLDNEGIISSPYKINTDTITTPTTDVVETQTNLNPSSTNLKALEEFSVEASSQINNTDKTGSIQEEGTTDIQTSETATDGNNSQLGNTRESLRHNGDETKLVTSTVEQTDSATKNLRKVDEEELTKRITQNQETRAEALMKINTQDKNPTKNQPKENGKKTPKSLPESKKKEKRVAQAKEGDTSPEEDPSATSEEEITTNLKESAKYEVSISSFTSIVSYGSLTKASSIDDRLVNNPREAISTIGYGIRAAYTLSDRAKLRLGVGYTPLKYRTNNFQVSINNGTVNIYELAAISGTALNQSGGTTANTPAALAFFSENSIVSIQQDISYIEVPLDVQYMLINKRLGLSVSPGLSMFILNDNPIFATSQSGTILFVGNDTNLNNLSLALNLGLGAHYNFNSKWRVNVEPVFRYQINPYSNSTSNFRPYYFGAQFGLSYKL